MDEVVARLTLYGQPVTKKNHQQMVTNKATGRMFPVQSKAYREYEHDCIRQITGDHKQQFVGRLNLCCRYWMTDRRQVDLLNLLAATSDILEKAGVVENDRNFVRVDGSEVAGVDRERPRVEITITRLPGEARGVQTKMIG